MNTFVEESMRETTLARILSVLAFCMLLCATVLAAYPAAAHAEGRRAMFRSPDRIVSRLKDRLDLSDEQANKIRPIIEESMQKHAALRKEMLQLRTATDENISAVLSPEQKKEFQKMRDERRGRPGARMHRRAMPLQDEP